MRPLDEGESRPHRVQLWLSQRPAWQVHGLLAISGAVATLGFAPFHIAPAFVLGLCVLVWALDDAFTRAAHGRAAFFRGWSFATGHFLAGTYWVGSAFAQVDGAMALMPFAIIALGGGLALFWAAACGVAMMVWTPDARRIPLLAGALFVAEMLRSHLFGGLPWNLAGYVWPAGSAVSQAASVIGAFGLTAVTLACAAAFATLADRRRAVARFGPSAAALLVIALLWSAGALRLQEAGDVAGPSPGPVVRVVDPGFTQREKWTPGRETDVLNKYLALTEPANANLARIVIWPEGALPARYPDFPPLLENALAVDAIAKTLGDRVLITGLTRVEADSEGRIARAYNAAAVLKGEDGALRLGQIHDKYRLTPFGEFIPLFSLISWLDIPTLQMIGSGFTPGPRPQRVVVPGADPAIIQICYESIFPGLIPRGNARPGWIVNVTNDAWFGKATGPWQHYNQARYRAIEEGLPMARAASGGVSAIVDAFGREVASTGMAGGAAEASLPGRLKETLYARLGWIITPIILVLLAAMRFSVWRGTRRTF